MSGEAEGIRDADSPLAIRSPALERSGKPVRVFADEHGLDPQRLYAWRRRVAGGDGTTFRELIVRPSTRLPVAGGEGCFEVVLPSGVMVRVSPSFDGSALERLLAVLQDHRVC